MNKNNSLFINRITTQPQLNGFDVVLRKGLNIVYAQDIGGLGSINSVGKSTFVNLLNYGLGSNTFIQSVVAKKRLENVFLLMELSIGIKRFTVKRKIISGKTCEVFDGWVIDRLIENKSFESDKKSLDEYKGYLEDLLFDNKNYFKDEKVINIREFIYPFFRVQGSGFEKIDEPLANYESAKVKRTRLQFITGLLSDRLKELNQEVEKKEQEEKEAKSEYQVIRKYVEHKTKAHKIELHIKKHEINDEIKQLELANMESKTKFKKLQDYLDNLYVNKENLRKELVNIEKQIEIVDSRAINYKATLNEISQEKKSLNLIEKTHQWFSNFEYKKCPTCLKPLKEHELDDCEIANENNVAIETLSAVLDNEKMELSEAYTRALVQKSQLVLMKTEVETKLAELNKQSDVDLDYLIASLDKVEERLKVLYEESALLDNLSNLIKDIDTFEEKWNLSKSELQEKLLELKNEKKSFDKRLEELKKDYKKVVEYLYNKTKFGILELSPKASNFKVSIHNNDEFRSEDKGDATNIMKVIAFDLALLGISNEDGNMHPRFLVHDSPNVRDIDPEVYKRIITYIEDMEKLGLDFQYIITTLLVPDNIKADSHYIRLKLHNDGDGGKLFGFTF
ncbi:uncharacterized protein YydD (DUF2326 family) [Paenibacillus taihuensis]|uniref:Uncharacterized protein YydD (DUF2326 family) n=1 Tax=Paenibacillus taihuensis TaxID=1156355 RepID=A0A3D9S338_9BACL|nr:DUF2326 domain-containing protein [Paenibacillus taihuensis]REE84561.1 uncharacterized protein YydD (DUF2326 family) [Paenibacillus taihuensis]